MRAFFLLFLITAMAASAATVQPPAKVIELTVVPTPSSPTYGIQEAINLIPAGGPGWGTNTTGACIHLAAGDYYFTNNIFYSNTFITSIRLEGASTLATRLIYAGNTTTNLIMFTGGGNPNGGLNLPIHVELEHLTFSSISNGQCPLVVITNTSAQWVRNCNFTGWQILTNNLHGTQVSIDGPAPANAQGNVGLVIGSSLDHGTFVEDCFFAGLATGIHVAGDHFMGINLKSAFIGEFGAGPGAGTAWANTSPYSLGAFIFRAAGLEARIFGLHAYICDGGIVNVSGQSVILIGPQWENCDHPLADNSTTSRFYLIEDAANSATSFSAGNGQWTIATSPYSYSAAANNANEILWNHAPSAIGVDFNSNSVTNAARYSAKTNLCSQPAAGFTPNYGVQNETANTNNGGAIVFAAGTLPSVYGGDMIYHEVLIHKSVAGDQPVIFPAPYVTNINLTSLGGTYRCTNNSLIQIRLWPGALTNVWCFPIN